MSNSKITKALLLATTAFVSMPTSTLAANPGGRVGKRIHPRHSDGQSVLKRRALSPRAGKVGKRMISPEDQLQEKQVGIDGKRALKLGKPSGTTGIRADKLNTIKLRNNLDR